MEDLTVAVQGFGNVGGNAALLLQNDACRIVAISDVIGAYYHERGIDIHAASAYCEKNRTLSGFETTGNAGKMKRVEDLLELEVDVLVPCALELVITSKNASRIRARYIAEGAN